MGNYQANKILKYCDEDIGYFSDEHSWYKHLPIDAKDNYFAIPMRECQSIRSRYILGNKYKNELHWYFIDSYDIDRILDKKLLKIIKKYPISINCMYNASNLLILVRDNYKKIWSWLKENYPDQYYTLEKELNEKRLNTHYISTRFNELYLNKDGQIDEEEKKLDESRYPFYQDENGKYQNTKKYNLENTLGFDAYKVADKSSVFREVVKLEYNKITNHMKNQCISLTNDLLKNGYNYKKLFKFFNEVIDKRYISEIVKDTSYPLLYKFIPINELVNIIIDYIS